jgi:hypothetical protein
VNTALSSCVGVACSVNQHLTVTTATLIQGDCVDVCRFDKRVGFDGRLSDERLRLCASGKLVYQTQLTCRSVMGWWLWIGAEVTTSRQPFRMRNATVLFGVGFTGGIVHYSCVPGAGSGCESGGNEEASLPLGMLTMVW